MKAVPSGKVMYAETRDSSIRAGRKGLSRPYSLGCGLPLVAVLLLLGLAAIWHLQYSELRMVTFSRQPVAAAGPESTLVSSARYICREVRPGLIRTVEQTGLVPRNPDRRWVLLLDREFALDWLVDTSPQQDDRWMPMDEIVSRLAVPTHAGPGRPSSATYMLGLVAYDARTGQFKVDPQAFAAFVASSAPFRDCPPEAYATLRAAASAGTMASPDGSAAAAVGWNGIVNITSNLRTGPGTGFPVFRVLPAGTGVVVVGISEDGEWLELDGGNWIFRSLITREDDGLASGPSAAGNLGTDSSTGPVSATGPVPAGRTAAADDEMSVSLSEAELQELRLYMLDLINRERTRRGLAPVALAFNEGAQRHADDLAANGYLSHWNLRGETPYMRHTWAGGHDYSAENAHYAGYVRAPDGFCAPAFSRQEVKAAMDSLMGSPGHRDNILQPLHREVNIGLAQSCQVMAVTQVFEGEYIRFSQPPELVGGRLVLAGQVGPEVALNDQTRVLVIWDPPLAEYTKGQVSQTYCYGTGRPIAYIRHPLPPGFTYQGGDSQVMDWERCPAPWDADPNLQLPTNRAEIERQSQRIREGYRIQEMVEVALVTAEVWQVEVDNFHIEADLRLAIQTQGPGIYTVVLQGEVDGTMEALAMYAIKVEG
ncbi:MAG: hypothetical protein F4Y08_03815 [Caldilineaceae bacterium SB0662_bin_9]|uniref:SCP domain-containing protein n=1 Tax=Caldilineaceae bacterium SB0662_bin_9 TaxID=2605258 RepID=A0A6B1DSU3_9CHLR|nr:hypothetical protein [Caldilineaceae bacterium SB0662_bin_9]